MMPPPKLPPEMMPPGLTPLTLPSEMMPPASSSGISLGHGLVDEVINITSTVLVGPSTFDPWSSPFAGQSIKITLERGRRRINKHIDTRINLSSYALSRAYYTHVTSILAVQMSKCPCIEKTNTGTMVTFSRWACLQS
jgi:hypothetical protein